MDDKPDQMLAAAAAADRSTVLWGVHPTAPSSEVVTSSQSEIKDLVGLFCMVTLNLIALLANAGVMAAVARAPHLKRFAFVCHLCAVDLLSAVLLMPLGIVSSSPYFAAVAFTVLECRVYIFLNVFLICASILTVTAISVERYYYIVHPMRYEVKMSINLALGVMAAIWVKSALLATVTLFGWPAYGPQSSIAASHCSLHWSHSRLRRAFALLYGAVCFLAPALVIFAVYCGVYKVARSAALQQAPPPAWATASAGAASSSSSSSSSSSGARKQRRSDSVSSQTTIITTGGRGGAAPRLTPERAFGGGKAALTLVVIMGQFVLCWLPYFSFHLHVSMGAPPLPGASDLEEAVTWLAYSSFAVNPFFYGLLNRQIREELVKFRRCCGGDGASGGGSSSVSRRTAELGGGAGAEGGAGSSQRGSLQENFLQFLQRTGSPRSAAAGDHGVRIPGQIPEEHG